MLHPDQKPLRLASVKGMNDILPEQAALWAHFEDAAQTTLRAYGYQRIRTPIVEHTSLFARSIGAATDIVEKEMYCFTDALNGEQLSFICFTMGPSVYGTAGRCSGMSVRNADVIASFISSVLKRWDSPARMWMPRLFWRASVYGIVCNCKGCVWS